MISLSDQLTDYSIDCSRNKDDAPVKKKMLLASSKDAISKKLDGLKKKIEANDESEIAYENLIG